MQTKKNRFNDNLKSKNILIPILFLLKIFSLRFGNIYLLDMYVIKGGSLICYR